VIALVVAGGLAAALSTAAGLLLVISSSISHDFLKRWLKPDITEKQELLSARIAIAAAVIIAGYAGLKPPGFVAQVVAFAFGLAAASFFPAIVMGIFSKRMNMQGAISGMIAGLVFTASYILYFKFKYLGGTPDQYLWGISPEGIGTLGMIVNFVVSFSVALVTPKPPQKVIDMIEEIRIPRGAGQSIEH
jgi:cation/acetate symporter